MYRDVLPFLFWMPWNEICFIIKDQHEGIQNSIDLAIGDISYGEI